MKANEIDTVTPVDMLTKLTEDVEFALDEYNSAIELENQASKVLKRRILLDQSRPTNPTAAELKLLEEEVDFFRKRFKERMKVRIKKKEIWDKRKLAKEKHKNDADEIERKENWVYQEGSNFNIRWSSLPS